MWNSPVNKIASACHKAVVRPVLDLLYPPCCHLCKSSSPASVLCSDCLEQVSFLTSPLCKICGQPFGPQTVQEDHHCGSCLEKRPPFDFARSIVRYETPVTTLLHRLKYQGDTNTIGPLKEIITMGRQHCSVKDSDIIVPVPLHRSRLRQRGINQSLVLAQLAFTGYKEKIVANLLVRVKNTLPQTGLTGSERRKNLKGAFSITAPGRIQDRQIWLVDDVYTTGTTVSECSEILKKKGAKAVNVWTFARV